MPTKLKESPAATGNPLITNETLKKLFTMMLKARMLAEAIAALPSGTQSQAGTEAALAGVISHLRPDDSLSPAPGDVVAAFLKGQPLDQLVSPFVTPVDASRKRFHGASRGFNLIPASADIRSHLSVANGIAIANGAQNQCAVSVAFFEHQASLKAQDFEAWIEPLRFAAAHQLPSLFVVLNRVQTSSRRGPAADYSARGQELGLPVIPVDGNDVVAVYRVAQESIIRARQGSSPTLIEARFSAAPTLAKRHPANTNGHLTGHPDPLVFMENYLSGKGLFSPAWKDTLVATFRAQLDSALKPAAKASQKQPSRN